MTRLTAEERAAAALADLTKANARRQAATAARDARTAQVIMDSWVWDLVPPRERRIVEARASLPGQSWEQIARRLHLTKDAAFAAWRRLVLWPAVQRVLSVAALAEVDKTVTPERVAARFTECMTEAGRAGGN